MEKGSITYLRRNNLTLYGWLQNQFKNKGGLSAVQKDRLHKDNESSKISRDFIEWYTMNPRVGSDSNGKL